MQIPEQSRVKNKKSKTKKSSKNPTDSIEIAMEVIFNNSLNTGNKNDYQNLSAQKSAEIARLLQENNAKSQNELLHIGEDTKTSSEESVQSLIKIEDSSYEDEDSDGN